jgi:hypothetical protein
MVTRPVSRRWQASAVARFRSDGGSTYVNWVGRSARSRAHRDRFSSLSSRCASIPMRFLRREAICLGCCRPLRRGPGYVGQRTLLSVAQRRLAPGRDRSAVLACGRPGCAERTEVVKRKVGSYLTAVGFLVAVGLLLAPGACTNLADVLCRPAGQCPDAPDGVNKAH